MEKEITVARQANVTDSIITLEKSIFAALETYSNVHRGSGHFSKITTELYDQARLIVLEHLNLSKDLFTVIFCTPYRAERLVESLEKEDYSVIESSDLRLSLGITAVAVKKKSIPAHLRLDVGGGTARLTSTKWFLWSKLPDLLEAGTPAIINVIAFAIALKMVKRGGLDLVRINCEDGLNTVNPVYSAQEILYDDKYLNYSGKSLLEKLVESMIGKGIFVPTISGDQPYINLDNGASTPTFLPVWDSFRQMLTVDENIKKEVISEVRTICHAFLSAPENDYDVIFTSNTTEAINAASRFMEVLNKEAEPVILNTYLEHTSNDLPWRMLKGYDLLRLKVDENGYIDLSELESLLKEYNEDGKFGRKRIRLLAISGASNVLGVYNNLQKASEIVHKYGAFILVDAAQLLAHRAIHMKSLNIDYLAFSGHKAYAPFGSGALLIRKGLYNPISKEASLIKSSGEMNAAGIAALGKTLLLLQRIGMDVIRSDETVKTARLLKGLEQIKGLTIFGIKDTDSPDFINKGGVVAFNHNKMYSNKTAKLLALNGIGIRYGCHCSHILVKKLLGLSPRLEKIQSLIIQLFTKMSLPGVARVSLGIENTEQEIDIFIKVLSETVNNTNKQSNSSVLKDIDRYTEERIRRVYNC